MQAFGVEEGSEKATVLAQCMGGAMFLRALAAAPSLFGPRHLLHNCTIGVWPEGVPDILRAKGGGILAYHEVDPDHMREAVAYKRLSALQNQG